MKAQPKVSDLVEILLAEINDLKQTIDSTSLNQKNLQGQLEDITKTSIKVDVKEIDKKLTAFEENLEIQIQKIKHNNINDIKRTFLDKSDFKLVALAILSSFLFGTSVTLIYNQSNKIKQLKDENTHLIQDK